MPKPNPQEDADDLKIDPNNVIESEEIKAPLDIPVVYTESECPAKSRIQIATSPEAFMQHLLRHHDETREHKGEACPNCERVIKQREQMMPGLIDRARKLKGAPIFGDLASTGESNAEKLMKETIAMLKQQNDRLVSAIESLTSKVATQK